MRVVSLSGEGRFKRESGGGGGGGGGGGRGWGDRHPKILPSKSPDFLGLRRYIASAYVKLLENSFTLIFK